MNVAVPPPANPDDPPCLEDFLGRLLAANAVSAAAIDRARQAAKISQERVDRVLLKLGLAGEAAVAECWSAVLGMPLIAPLEFPERPVLADVLPARFLRSSAVLPVDVDGQVLRLAVVDPLDIFAQSAVAACSRLQVRPVLTTFTDLATAFARLYPDDRPSTAETAGAHADVVAGDVIRLQDLATDAPAIRWVEQMVERAIDARASDIHITISRAGTRLRYRIDGVLNDVEPHPSHLHAAVISRLKVLAELDIAERRLPQDGRIRLDVGGREIDLRVATMPHLDGEGVVLRILDRTAVKLDLPLLGFRCDIEQALLQLLTEPHGIFLVTGPTGSGKTTTLYAALRHLVMPERNVISVEDPVEYHLEGVAQIQVQRKIGLDFPTVLRAVLRQDPDVIMIGEIRDGETAAIANQAALTGHFVLATLHTNSAAAALPRLIDMGLEPYLLSSTVRGILSQRLLRTLCSACSRVVPPEQIPLAYLKKHAQNRSGITAPEIREPVGCPQCNRTGYRGRTAISELLLVDDAIRQAILDRADAAHIDHITRAKGLIPLAEAGLERVFAGETSFAELLRVTGDGADR